MSAVEAAVELPQYEVVGKTDAPVVIALGGISANRRVCEWWPGVAGAHRALDTERYRVLGVDYLDRPGISTHDQADAIATVLDQLGVQRAHALIGASYGGMVALAFAELYPERLERLVVIGAADRAHPMITAQRVIQRRIIELGVEVGREQDAVTLARALAITTYRSAREFEERFIGRRDVESFLFHNAERFAQGFSAQRYLALSLSSDMHRVDPSRVTAVTTLVAAEGDTVVPREQVERLASALAGPSRIVDLPATTGHDAFLTEQDALGRILHNAVTQSVS